MSCWNKFRGQQDTEAELDAEEVFFSPSTAAGAFTILKLPVAAKRNNNNGMFNHMGANGNYWLSTVSGTNAGNLKINS